MPDISSIRPQLSCLGKAELHPTCDFVEPCAKMFFTEDIFEILKAFRTPLELQSGESPLGRWKNYSSHLLGSLDELESAEGGLNLAQAGDLEAARQTFARLLDSSCPAVLAAAYEFQLARRKFEIAGLLMDLLLMESEARGDIFFIALAKSNLAQICRQKADFKGCIKLAEQSLSGFEEIDSSLGIARALEVLGRSCLAANKISRAEKCFERALTLRKQLGWSRAIVHGLKNIADISFQRLKFGKAENLMKSSMELAQSSGDISMLATGWSGLGDVCYIRGQARKAAEHYSRSIEINVSIGNRPGLAANHASMGLLFWNYDDFRNAEIAFNVALDLFGALKDDRGIAEVQRDLARLYEHTEGLTEKAEFYYESACASYERLQDTEMLAETLKKLGMLRAGSGDPVLASRNFADAAKLFSKLRRKKNVAEIRELLSKLQAPPESPERV